jgi:hypothetical protein
LVSAHAPVDLNMTVGKRFFLCGQSTVKARFGYVKTIPVGLHRVDRIA